MCPAKLQGATIKYEDTASGGAIVFTTTGDVAALREHVKAMAAHHEQMAQGHGNAACPCDAAQCKPGEACPCAGCEGQKGEMKGHPMMKGHMMGKHGMEGMGPMMSAKATTEEMPNGIKLTLTPANAADAPQLREHMKAHAEKMSEGHCPMMGHPPAPAKKG